MAERLTRCFARPGRAVARLAHDRRGSAMIEFAICGSAFIALLLGTLQVALVYFAQQSIQTSAETLARKIMTGQIKQSTMTAAAFRTSACATLPEYMRCNRLVTDVRAAMTFSSLDMSMPVVTYDAAGNVTGGTQYNTGVAGGVVVIRLMYRWPINPGPLGLNLSNTASNSERVLVGTMVFKSEPYV